MSKPPSRPPKVIPLDKKVPKNEKYAAVEGVVDTGFNMRKFMEIHNARFHKEELFKRIRVSHLIALVNEYGYLWQKTSDVQRESIHSSGGYEMPPLRSTGGSYTDPPSRSYQDPPRSYQDPPRSYHDPPRTGYSESGGFPRSTYQDQTSYPTTSDNASVYSSSAPMSPLSTQRSQLAGGEWMSPVKPTEDLREQGKKWIEQPDCPYLLLDVRDKDDFEKCHIRSAINYPAPMLSRSVNALIPEIYAYKNKDKRMIIIYDEDEKISGPMGNSFFEKQFDNVFVLSYGLRKFAEMCPELIVGEPPPPPPSALKKKQPSARPSGMSTPSSARSLNSSSYSLASRSTAIARTMSGTGTSGAWK